MMRNLKTFARIDRTHRGSVMIFVLALLALLALVGLALIARTHTDHRRVHQQSDATSIDDAMNGVVRAIDDRLGQDIWGAITDPSVLPVGADPNDLFRPLSDLLPPGGVNVNSPNYFGILENNEPWDKPGRDDEWLASLLPYYAGTFNVQGVMPTLVPEQDVLVWEHPSYIGQDLLLPPATATFAGSPFMWASNSRDPLNPNILQYPTGIGGTRHVLSNIPVIQTPAPGPFANQALIPGSTTNVTIAQARVNWRNNHEPVLIGAFPNVKPQFPYFDTNWDGVPDLYDADGDGVPDSPISLVIPIDTGDPNRDKTLYAVVRIVDHAAMVNVNTASALRLRPDSSGNLVNDLTFNGLTGGLERRGRRATEIALDGVLHRDDWLPTVGNRAAGMAAYRSNGTNPLTINVLPDPVAYDFDMARRLLIGGRPDPTAPNYFTFDLNDESSLRHRGQLVRYDRRDADLEAPGDYTNIDRAARETLIWSRSISSAQTGTYNGNARWSRLNNNYQPLGTANPTYEGYSPAAGIMGWRKQMDEDDPSFVRKPLLTTINAEVRVPPKITRASMPTAPIIAPFDSMDMSPRAQLETRLRELWAIGMNWPVLIERGSDLEMVVSTEAPQFGSTAGSPLNGSLVDALTVATEQMPPEWARVLPFDINMGTADPAQLANVKADFIRYAAAAMYFALDNVSSYQGIDLSGGGGLMREYLAWQFAVNLYDYRDQDSVPTTISWPTQPGVLITGVEKQPFFTEAVVYMEAGAPPLTGPAPGPGTGAPTKWFFSVEMFVPPGWTVNPNNLYLRSPGTTMGLRPLTGFRQVTTDTALTTLSGGSADVSAGDVTLDGDHGNYYVFTGSQADAPAPITTDLAYQAKAHYDNQFRIATNGRGSVELVYSLSGTEGDPTNVVLDVIGPDYAGGALANNTASGFGRWAFRDPSIPEGAVRGFSLRRSTKGWRFTTAWHVYSESPSNNPGSPPFNVSLGRPNPSLSALTNNIPESVWPNLTSFNTVSGAVPDSFATGNPFEAFDSVADLSRQFMIGPVNLDRSTVLDQAYANLNLPIRNAPTTLVLARMLQSSVAGDLPSLPRDRVAAGRVDYFDARRIGSGNASPSWTWRLFDYMTAESHLFDSVDNDGDGFADLADPTESWKVLFRETGRINMHSAPATVLRAVPGMSLLPTSPELALFDGGAAMADPFATYVGSAPGSFHDFASALVALRENRDVSIRVYDPGTSQLRPIALAHVNTGPSPGPGMTASRTSQRNGAFYGAVEMARLRGGKVSDIAGGANDLFEINRLGAISPLELTYQRVRTDVPFNGPAGTESPLSPDFRYRRDGGITDYVPIQAASTYTGDVNGVESDMRDAGGVRGRGIYLSRMANVLSTRSDVFTAYIALLDEDGNYVRRSQVTLDRSDVFREIAPLGGERRPVSPRQILREDGNYYNDLK